MPNTPALVKEGATAYFGNDQVTPAQCLQVETIFSAVGIVAQLENEAQINAITALSGSGPAYYFLFMEAMQKAAIKLGLNDEVVRRFAIQTAYGAAKLAKTSETSVTTLREQVTSKKGTTAAAIEVMQTHGLDKIVDAALQAANTRAIELSQGS